MQAEGRWQTFSRSSHIAIREQLFCLWLLELRHTHHHIRTLVHLLRRLIVFDLLILLSWPWYILLLLDINISSISSKWLLVLIFCRRGFKWLFQMRRDIIVVLLLWWAATGIVGAWWTDNSCVATWNHHVRLLLMGVDVTTYSRIQIDRHCVNSLRSHTHWRQILKWGHWSTHVLRTASLLHHPACANQVWIGLLLLLLSLLLLSNILITTRMICSVALRTKACCTGALLSHHNIADKVLVLLAMLVGL